MNDKWNSRFMELAITISKWSKDYKKVGAVIVDSETKQILSCGFNGMPNWYDDSTLHTLSSYDKGRMITHAEINALNHLDKTHFNKDLVMYVTKSPCLWCANFIVNSNANIKEIYYIPNSIKDFDIRYKVQESLDVLSQKQITAIKYEYISNLKFEMIVTIYLHKLSKNLDYIELFISETKDLLINLSLEEDPNILETTLPLLLDYYGYMNIHKFCIETNSSNPNLFEEWFNNKSKV